VVLETGRPIAQVAGLGINEGTLGNWVARERQAPGEGRACRRPGRRLLIRADAGSCRAAAAVLDRLTLPSDLADTLEHIPEHVWPPAYDADERIREGAHVAEVNRPARSSLLAARRGCGSRPPRATPTTGASRPSRPIRPGGPGTQLPALDLRHRRRPAAEDRLCAAEDTGLTNLPQHDFAQNQIWCALVALARELLAWLQMLPVTDSAVRRWEH
jgi:Transposase DDE domain group 1